ncbi:MAG TPA: hypothetical protein VFI95_06410 [Terriglobales bacterium]|nr:hypothetical protein [Terriglobales bacterium]
MSCVKFASIAVLLLLMSVAALSQQTAAGGSRPTVDNAFVQKQFGAEFSLVPEFAPMIADFDADGVEDIALVARAKNPLIGEAEFKYKAVDPYHSFFGIGDPKITTTFGSEDPAYTGYVLLIVHGAGADAWRSSSPKSKFVVVSLPFKTVAVKHILVKKKVISAIYAEETSADEMTSVVYFDGKHYKYEPMGSNLH